MSRKQEALDWLSLQNRPEPCHDLRFAQSVEYIDQTIGQGFTSAIELGHESIFTYLLRAYYPRCSWEVTGHRDLREAMPDLRQGYDLVVMTEVLEHLKDRDDGPVDTWHFSGAKQCLIEVNRLLRPGGHLFLTTPNACCWAQVWALLEMRPPFFYAPHVREYAPQEVVNIVTQAGLEVTNLNTYDVWGQHGLRDDHCSALEAVTLDWQLPTNLRGDDLFLVARKPLREPK